MSFSNGNRNNNSICSGQLIHTQKWDHHSLVSKWNDISIAASCKRSFQLLVIILIKRLINPSDQCKNIVEGVH